MSKSNLRRVGKLCSCLALAAMLTTGCTAKVPLASTEQDILAKKRLSSPDKCLIYVYRISQFQGSALPVDIILNENNYIGQMAPGTYFLLEVAPGMHSINIPKMPMAGTPRIDLSCRSGETYFVRCKVEYLFYTLKLVDESTGRTALASSNLINTASFTETLTPSPGSDQSKGVTLAVLSFASLDFDANQLTSFTDQIRRDVSNTGLFRVVSAEYMKYALKQSDFAVTGRQDTDELVKAGKILDVAKVVAGTIHRSGETVRITLKMVDVASEIVNLTLERETTSDNKGVEAAISQMAKAMASAQ